MIRIESRRALRPLAVLALFAATGLFHISAARAVPPAWIPHAVSNAATEISDHLPAAVAHDAANTLQRNTWTGAVLGFNHGGVQGARLMRVKANHTLTIHRIYTDPGGRRLGGWWTHDAPGAITKAAYRGYYEICKSWNPAMNKHVTCTLQAGATFVIGLGESINPCAPVYNSHAPGPAPHPNPWTGEKYARGTINHPQIFVYRPLSVGGEAHFHCAAANEAADAASPLTAADAPKPHW